ncbi:MAG: phosphatidylglycerol lysyltransferase domain-containing protein [Candidatus Omnitrophica bacterium]|nr:phosphatidylglycerol lysyltransferase domain-containing protein [Candidatus Omnitrophota bacterium]
MRRLSLADKLLFSKYLNAQPHDLSVYAFENIYIWKNLFEVNWRIIEGRLCIFFRDQLGCFLYLPPLGDRITPDVLNESFKIMDRVNKKNRDASRIENIEEKEISAYTALGLNCAWKSRDYVYRRSCLVNLKGDKFKSKRASYNYFLKHNKFEYRAFGKEDSDECLAIYLAWIKQRTTGRDKLYDGMLKDSLNSFIAMLEGFGRLDLTGRVVTIDGKIKAFTFGYKLNASTFCVLYEIADLEIKGLAQFIFRAFCAELKEYSYINVMDDSGLENLARVKLSYRPLRLLNSYIATRKECLIQ